jgi:hypothetical protein
VGRDFADTTRAARWRVMEHALDQSASAVTRNGSPVSAQAQRQLLATFIPAQFGVNTLLTRQPADTALYVGREWRSHHHRKHLGRGRAVVCLRA